MVHPNLSFLFPSERLLLPARGTVFYRTNPEFLSQCRRGSRATYHLSQSHSNSQEKARRCAWSNSWPVWSPRYVCIIVSDAADVWLIVHLRVFLVVKRRQAAGDLSNNLSCRCSKCFRTSGEGEGGVGEGEGAAEGRRPGWVAHTALSQQRALGGDHGGGRLQAHRIPRQR